jgi:CRISPR/Cas system-associated exonuclease Cas4 (RecB family)
MLIEHISISRHGVFTECEQHYKFKYHLKIPSPEPTPVYFDYGKIIHKIIEVYTLDRGKTDIGSIASKVLQGEIELEKGKKAPRLEAEYQRKLPEHLRSFMKLTEKIGTEGLVEWPFTYDLNPPNKHLLVGFIDRIIVKGDEYTLIDYKTTKKGPWRKTSKNITSDLQLQAYCRIVQKTFNVSADKIKAALYFLEGGELVGAKFSQKTLDHVENKLLQMYQEIKNKEPDHVRGNVGRHCKRCPYRMVCPFYALT